MRVRPRRHSLALPIAGVLLLLGAAAGARACTIPVFRYALEYWAPSSYEIVVFHRGPFAAGERAALEELSKLPGNFRIRGADVGGRLDEADEALWTAQGTKELPWAVVRFPDAGEKAPSLWAGKLDKAALAERIDSPARRELARRLVAGESCVWVLLGGGDAQADDRVAATLGRELKRLEESVTLPEVAPDGPQLKSPLPLRVKFSVLRVSADDPREAALVRALRLVEPDYADSGEALVVPVIGRGRAVSALPGSRVNGERLGAFAEFVCGQCSCEVKELNPGIDLLVAADWDVIFEEPREERVAPPAAAPELVVKSVPIPPRSRPAAATAPSTSPADAAAASQYIPVEPQAKSHVHNWLLAGIGAAAVAAVMSGAAVLRGGRRK